MTLTLANTVPQIHTAMLTSRMSLKLHAYLYQVHRGLDLLREACQAQHALRDSFGCVRHLYHGSRYLQQQSQLSWLLTVTSCSALTPGGHEIATVQPG